MSYGSRGSSVFQIAGLNHIVRWWLYRQGYKWLDVPPSVVKKFATGKGNSPKSVMIKAVYKKWGFDVSDDNLADSYALARFHRAYLAGDEPHPLERSKKRTTRKGK
jgi:crossover junction endodeoxyribonuclease RuvC